MARTTINASIVAIEISQVGVKRVSTLLTRFSFLGALKCNYEKLLMRNGTEYNFKRKALVVLKAYRILSFSQRNFGDSKLCE